MWKAGPATGNERITYIHFKSFDVVSPLNRTVDDPRAPSFLEKNFSTDHFNAVPFPKDQKSDHVFPSRPARSSGMPFGHLRPLGTQRKPEGHIKEFDASLTSAFAFYELTNERTPFMAKNFFPKTSEASDWDDISLEKYGDVPVEIYQRLPGDKIKRTVKNIGEVLGLYHGHDIFIKTTIPSEIESHG